jgi:hypothetical protein
MKSTIVNCQPSNKPGMYICATGRVIEHETKPTVPADSGKCMDGMEPNILNQTIKSILNQPFLLTLLLFYCIYHVHWGGLGVGRVFFNIIFTGFFHRQVPVSVSVPWESTTGGPEAISPGTLIPFTSTTTYESTNVCTHCVDKTRSLEILKLCTLATLSILCMSLKMFLDYNVCEEIGLDDNISKHL